MKLTVNGEERELPGPLSVERLLQTLKIESGHVAVEVNREIVRRARRGERLLHDGDQVEIVTFVGGG